MDLWGNCKIRDKTDAYLQGVVNELIQLVTEDERCQSVIKEMINFDHLKFKERDALEDVLSSYHNSHEYDIEKYRDTRLRSHYKERYDNRRNMVDWDYSFYVAKIAKHINSREYHGWRKNGLAFETRLASNNVPNRTFGSFVPGEAVSLLPNLITVVNVIEKQKQRQDHGAWLLGRYCPVAFHSLRRRNFERAREHSVPQADQLPASLRKYF